MAGPKRTPDPLEPWGVMALIALVGFGLSVLTSLLLLGACSFSCSLAAGSESVLILLWLLGGCGIIGQGAIGVLLFRLERRPARRSDTGIRQAQDSMTGGKRRV